MITLADVQAAAQLTSPYIRRTPLMLNRILDALLGTHVYLKMELFQKTGSFKPRGAFNQILQLDEETRKRGGVAVSGGNFAQAAAYASATLGIDTVICMPAYTPQNYIDATRSYGAQVALAADFPATFALAAEYEAQGRTLLHPYDNPHMIAGNGSLGLELIEDVPEVTDVVISIGGGGLIAGTTVALKGLRPDVRVWGVETEGAETMTAALKAGKSVPYTPTSLAKTLGGPYAAQDALEIVQEHVEEVIVVSDQAAINDQRFLLERAKVLTELAASCTLAAARTLTDRWEPDDQVVLVLCGGNESLSNMIGYQAGESNCRGAAHL